MPLKSCGDLRIPSVARSVLKNFSFTSSIGKLTWECHKLLCTALETANKLVHSTNSNVGMLKDKVEELCEVINRRDATIEAAKAFEGSPKQPESS